jgi:hypothetical protein
MPITDQSGGTVESRSAPSEVTTDIAQVNTILARTNWNQYWDDVSDQVCQEVEAYDSARARSFATASRRFIR